MGGILSTSPSPIPLESIVSGSTEIATLCKHMIEDGFSVIALDESYYETIEKMYEIGKVFLQQDMEQKNVNSDSKNENLGFVDIPGVRDFIKLRGTGDRQGEFPKHPADFKESFLRGHEMLAEIAWKLFLELLRSKEVQPDPNYFPESVVVSLKECLNDMASTSIIRYYLPPSSATTGVRDVCDEHTDTGILTLILCSKVSGLQVWDRKNNCWAEVEKHLIDKYKTAHPRKHLVMCIMGEKVRMFTGSEVLIPTKHRVMVANGIERFSLLYFMDTAK